MYQDQRVIYQTTDISKNVNDFRSGTQPFAYNAGEYLYVGSIMPFNNLYFDLATANENAANVSIQMWFGNAWVNAVDVIDETSGLTSSGRISWNTDRLKAWDIEQDSGMVSGITSFEIYNKFWLRLSWSASFSAGTIIKYIGQKFANDDTLYSYYPDFNNLDTKAGFESGKTSWDEQHYMAVEYIVADLKNRGIIKSRSQLMDWSIFKNAACRRVACIIYTAFGAPYIDQLTKAESDYSKAMDINYFMIDTSANGSLDPTEVVTSVRFGTR
jgi:hypothetical protein